MSELLRTIRRRLRLVDLSLPRLAVLIPIIAFLIIFLIYPLSFALIKSVRVRTGGETVFTFRVFTNLFRTRDIWLTIFNSLFIGAAVTLTTTIVSVPLALMTARYTFRGKWLINAVTLAPMVLPPFVGSIAIKQLFSNLGAVNNLLLSIGLIDQPVNWFESGITGVILMETLHLYPIMVLNVAAALANVDPSLEDAARLAGAGRWRRFFTITFPLAKPGYFAGATLIFIWAFTDLGTPLIFNVKKTIPVKIFDMYSSSDRPDGYALLALLMVLTATLFVVTKKLIGDRRAEMLSRGHAGDSVRPAGRLQTAAILIYGSVLAAFALLPHFGVLLLSVSGQWFNSTLPESLTLAHFISVGSDTMTRTAIVNSLMLAGASTIPDIIIGVTIAWFLTRTRIPGRSLLDATVMLPLAVPGLVLAFAYLNAFSGTFLDVRGNPFPLLIISYSMRRLPYMVRAAVAGLKQTDSATEDAARNAGATPLRAMITITVPLILANVIAGAIMCFSFAMLEVSDSLILASREQHFPITKALYDLVSQPTPTSVNVACAMGVIGMVILGGCLLLASRMMGRSMGELFKT
ncbi:MAG: iron ABC transporter permease [Planctomycetota bacterium]